MSLFGGMGSGNYVVRPFVTDMVCYFKEYFSKTELDEFSDKIYCHYVDAIFQLAEEEIIPCLSHILSDRKYLDTYEILRERFEIKGMRVPVSFMKRLVTASIRLNLYPHSYLPCLPVFDVRFRNLYGHRLNAPQYLHDNSPLPKYKNLFILYKKIQEAHPDDHVSWDEFQKVNNFIAVDPSKARVAVEEPKLPVNEVDLETSEPSSQPINPVESEKQDSSILRFEEEKSLLLSKIADHDDFGEIVSNKKKCVIDVAYYVELGLKWYERTRHDSGSLCLIDFLQSFVMKDACDKKYLPLVYHVCLLRGICEETSLRDVDRQVCLDRSFSKSYEVCLVTGEFFSGVLFDHSILTVSAIRSVYIGFEILKEKLVGFINRFECPGVLKRNLIDRIETEQPTFWMKYPPELAAYRLLDMVTVILTTTGMVEGVRRVKSYIDADGHPAGLLLLVPKGGGKTDFFLRSIHRGVADYLEDQVLIDKIAPRLASESMEAWRHRYAKRFISRARSFLQRGGILLMSVSNYCWLSKHFAVDWGGVFNTINVLPPVIHRHLGLPPDDFQDKLERDIIRQEKLAAPIIRGSLSDYFWENEPNQGGVIVL